LLGWDGFGKETQHGRADREGAGKKSSMVHRDLQLERMDFNEYCGNRVYTAKGWGVDAK